MHVLVLNIPLHFSSQELCKKLHAKIESVDEERYDTEVKLQKTTKEVSIPRGHPAAASAQPLAHPSSLPMPLAGA